MRKRMLNPMAAFAVVAMLAFGCSSSRTADDMSASTTDTVMNDTGSMAQADNTAIETETSVAYNSQI